MSDPHAYFSPSYEVARRRFIATVEGHPHLVERGQLSIDADHSIDWAFTGDASEKDVLVYTSGLHGIEGYAGSAVQLKLLELGQAPPPQCHHALTPNGRPTYRPDNENNSPPNPTSIPHGPTNPPHNPPKPPHTGLNKPVH